MQCKSYYALAHSHSASCWYKLLKVFIRFLQGFFGKIFHAIAFLSPVLEEKKKPRYEYRLEYVWICVQTGLHSEDFYIPPKNGRTSYTICSIKTRLRSTEKQSKKVKLGLLYGDLITAKQPMCQISGATLFSTETNPLRTHERRINSIKHLLLHKQPPQTPCSEL